MGARTGRSRLRQAFLALARLLEIGWSRRLGLRFNHLLPVGMGRPQVATARRWHLCVLARLSPRLTTNTVQEGRNAVTGGYRSQAPASEKSGLPVSDREAVFLIPVVARCSWVKSRGVVYSRSVGDGGQRSCTQSASPVRRASCSGSIVRPQALQFCLGVGKVIFNRQPLRSLRPGVRVTWSRCDRALLRRSTHSRSGQLIRSWPALAVARSMAGMAGCAATPAVAASMRWPRTGTAADGKIASGLPRQAGDRCPDRGKDVEVLVHAGG